MKLVLSLVLLLLVTPPLANVARADSRLLGPWKAVTYTIGAKDYPMQGVFIFTAKYYAGNVRFKFSGGTVDDANANSGPYRIEGNAIVFSQTVQVHLRPGDAKEPLLSREGPDERSNYRIDGNRLTLTFPGGNRYVLERLSDQ